MQDMIETNVAEIFHKLMKYSNIIQYGISLSPGQIVELEQCLKYCKPEKLSLPNNTILDAIECCLYLQLHSSNKNYNELSSELATLLHQNSGINPEELEEISTKYIQARFEFLFDTQAVSILRSSEQEQNDYEIDSAEKRDFEQLPVELIEYIASMSLEQSFASALVLTCKRFNDIIQPRRLAKKLLLHVARGEQDAAEAILKDHPGLLLARGTVTDHAGRKFENITAFELAIWNLDTRYMCGMMLKCIPESDLGHEIKLGLWGQLESIEARKVNYFLNNEKPSSPYYDFDNLINSLEEFVRMCVNRTYTDAELDNYWCKTVGGAQRNAPMQVLQHYCEPGVPFDPCPNFNKESFNRSGKIYDFITRTSGRIPSLLSSSSSLDPHCSECRAVWRDSAQEFGIAMYAHKTFFVVARVVNVSGLSDLAALKKLCKVRTADLTSLRTQLSSEVKLLGYEQETESSSLLVFK